MNIPHIDPSYLPSSRFPKRAFQEARRLWLPEKELEAREEAQGFTIDGPSSKDLDDAIWLQEHENKQVVSVTVADVDSLVGLGSEVDREALKRVETNYFGKHRNVPMLPKILSENQLSLLEAQWRPTVTVDITLSDGGEMEGVHIRLTKIRSIKRTSYQEVGNVLRDSEHKDHSFLKPYKALAEQLFALRRSKGALAIFDLKKGLMTDEEGRLVKPRGGELSWGNLIVQEFMILANEAVAQFLKQHQAPGLYRNHLLNKTSNSAEVQSLLEEASAYPEVSERIRLEVRQCIGRAQYGADPKGHFGLQLSAYTHFTSPIRRYADLVVHRIVKALVAEEKPPYTQEECGALSVYINARIHQVTEVRNDFYRRKMESTAKRKLDRFEEKDLRRLSEKDFKELVRRACQTDYLTDELEGALLQRFEDGLIEQDYLFMILFVARNHGQHWQRLTKAALTFLESHRALASGLLNNIVQRREELNGRVLSEDSCEEGWTAQVLMMVDGQIKASPQMARADRRTTARHGAALLFLKAYLDDTLIHPDTSASVLHFEKQDGDSFNPGTSLENPVGELNGLCQKKRWQAEYDFHQLRTGHRPVFSGSLQLLVDGEVFSVVKGRVTGSKGELKELLAKKLLQELSKAQPQKGARQKKQAHKSSALAQLNSIAAMHGIDRADFIESRKQTGFYYVASIEIQGNQHRVEGRPAARKKTAKQQAAEDLLAHINPLLTPKTPKKPSIPKVNSGPISVLQTHFQKLGQDLPQYRYEVTESGFLCICQTVDGREATGEAPSKKAAKKLAARAMLDLVEAS